MDFVDLNNLCQNRIEIRSVDSLGRRSLDQVLKNTYTYAAADIFINGLLRSGPSQVTHLYARFGDSGSNPGTLSPKDNDYRNATREDFIKSSNSAVGGLWVPILSAPAQTTTDKSTYEGNQANFFFRIPGNIDDSQVEPSGNFDPATSYIYELGLAVALNTGDRSQDRIISVLDSVTKFQVPANGQKTVDYIIKYLVKEQ